MRSEFDPAALLRLISIPNIGAQRIRKLVSRLGSPEAVLSSPISELVKTSGIDYVLAKAIHNGGDKSFVSTQLNRMQACGAGLVSYWDSGYPDILKQINDPPVILYYKGDPDCLKKQSIAVVGTRAPSTYGKMMTEKITGDLVRQKMAIVSGLARGIDTIAHWTAIRNGGITIAVLGSGVDQIYPEENCKLAEEISTSGVVVSEFAMGAKPDAPHFPRRNRIISGLSLGTLVIEAGNKSGALLTADFALGQNREVFALPGNANSMKSMGANRLIQRGAKLVISTEDVLEEIRGQLEMFREEETAPKPALSGLDEAVYNALSPAEEKHIDLIAAECKASTGQVLSALLTLELQGLVKQLAGKNFIRC